MDLITLYNILENSDLTREVVSSKNDAPILSYIGDETISVSVDNEEYDEVFKICLVNNESFVNVYLNYNNRFKLKKIKLEDITDFIIL